jgi:hypothetical protein
VIKLSPIDMMGLGTQLSVLIGKEESSLTHRVGGSLFGATTDHPNCSHNLQNCKCTSSSTLCLHVTSVETGVVDVTP